MVRSVKSNYILNLINTGSRLLFPLITFPYVSRVMEADGVGLINFYSSIINYISLFTCLGIPLYAIREIAYVRNDKKLVTIKTIEILSLLGILTLLGYIAVFLICIIAPSSIEYIPIYIIVSSTLLFNAIGCEWFYQGIEDFFYVTVRGLVIRLLSIVFLFCFVKTKQDIVWFAVYSVISSIGGNLSNLFRLRKYIEVESVTINDIHPFVHLKPSLKIFAYNVVVSVYVQLNTVLLGFMKVAADVGIFTVGIKVMKMIMDMSNSLTVTIMPRSSSLLAENKIDEFKQLIQKSYDFSFFFLLPVSVGLFILSPFLVLILSGISFEASITVARIVSPLIFIVGLSCVFGSQSLYPMGKMNLVTYSSITGAIVDLLLNIILVPSFSYVGTAIAYLSAELAVFAQLLYYAKKNLNIQYWKPQYKHYIFGTLLMSFFMILVWIISINDIVKLLLMFIVGLITYLTYMLVQKDFFATMLWNMVLHNKKL